MVSKNALPVIRNVSPFTLLPPTSILFCRPCLQLLAQNSSFLSALEILHKLVSCLPTCPCKYWKFNKLLLGTLLPKINGKSLLHVHFNIVTYYTTSLHATPPLSASFNCRPKFYCIFYYNSSNWIALENIYQESFH